MSVSKNEDDEPGLYEMKKRLVSMLHMSLPPQEKVEDQSWYHAAETEIQGTFFYPVVLSFHLLP